MLESDQLNSAFSRQLSVNSHAPLREVRIDEHEEIRRHLDPLVFHDRDFMSQHWDGLPTDNSKMSFIELTTQIGNEAKIVKPSRPAPLRHHTTIVAKSGKVGA